MIRFSVQKFQFEIAKSGLVTLKCHPELANADQGEFGNVTRLILSDSKLTALNVVLPAEVMNAAEFKIAF